MCTILQGNKIISEWNKFLLLFLFWSVTGPVKEEDVLVLPLDCLKFETHAPAVQTVLDHFGQVDASFSV